MDVFVLIAGLLLVISVGAGVLWLSARRRPGADTDEEADVGRPGTGLTMRSGEMRADADGHTVPEEGVPAALLVQADDADLLIEPVRSSPSETTLLPAVVASQLASEVGRLVPALQLARQANADQVFRLVKAPPGGLTKVADESRKYRGFGLEGGAISGHGEFEKVTMSGVLSPQLALSLATAALGMYWQQQIDSTLKEIEGAVKAVQKHLNLVLDASVERAEETLREHEAAPPPGRYEPPAIVTDGLVAARVHRKKLEDRLEDLQRLEKRHLSHNGYMREVLAHKSEEPLAELLFKAIRGLSLDVRVLRLKQRTSLGEPAHRQVLNEHNARLQKDLELMREVVLTARAIQSSNRHDGVKVELPAQRRARQKSQKGKANRLRGQLKELIGLLDTVEPFVVLPDLDNESVELYLTMAADGSARAVAAPAPAAALPAGSE